MEKSKYWKNPKDYLIDKGIIYEPKVLQLNESWYRTKTYSFNEVFDALREKFKKK